MSNNPEMSGEKLYSPSLPIALFHPSIPHPSQESTANYSLAFIFSNHFL